MVNDITVILNVYKRPNTLKEQIQAIKNQTVNAKDIWIWYNKPEDRDQVDLRKEFGNYKIIQANHNFKYHARFAMGLMAKTEYVAFFDDDTIPASGWFKNCLDTIAEGHDGILGTTGVVLHGDKYHPNHKVGWNGRQVDKVVEVDLVGHAWFMRKDYLRYLFYEEPITWKTGEDIQLSYLAQKYGNVRTYVPPHPQYNKSMWGSIPDKGYNYGNDKNSSWRIPSTKYLRDELARKQINRGWKLVRNR